MYYRYCGSKYLVENLCNCQDADGLFHSTWTLCIHNQRTIIQSKCNMITDKLATSISLHHGKLPPCRALVILFPKSKKLSVSQPMQSDLARPVQAATQLEETKA